MGCGGSSKKTTKSPPPAGSMEQQSFEDIIESRGRSSTGYDTLSSIQSDRLTHWNDAAINPGFLFSRLRQAQTLKNTQLDSACMILKQTFDSAISRLDEVNENNYNVVTMMLQHARDALTEWTHGDTNNLYDIPLQEIEMKAKDANVDIMSGDEGLIVGKFSIVSSTSTEDSTSISHIFVDPQFLFDKLSHAQRLKQSYKIDKATNILQKAFDNAIQDLDSLEEKYFKATTALMQHMRDALTEWKASNTTYDIPLDSIAEDKMFRKFISRNTIDDRFSTTQKSISVSPTRHSKRNGR